MLMISFPPLILAQSSLLYTAAKISACVVFAPVVVPYYITKTSIQVALIPTKAVYNALTTDQTYE